MRKTFFAACSALMLLDSFPATATIIDNVTFTTDTATGLDWLDVTASSGDSIDFVSSQFGAGGVFAGWRYATAAELTTLLLNFGITTVPHSDSPATQLTLHQTIIQTLGVTFTNPNLSFTEGYIADEGFLSGSMGPYRYIAVISEAPPPIDQTVADPFFTLYPFDTSVPSSGVGSFLVRDAVAVPGPIAGAGIPGLALACGGLLAFWRRYRTKGTASAHA